jgi:hypothetical protein
VVKGWQTLLREFNGAVAKTQGGYIEIQFVADTNGTTLGFWHG